MESTMGSDMPEYARWFAEDFEERIKIYPKAMVRQRTIAIIPIPSDWW